MPPKRNRKAKKGKGLASLVTAAASSDVEDMFPGTAQAGTATEDVSDQASGSSNSESEEEDNSSHQGSEAGSDVDDHQEDQQLLPSHSDEEEAP